jgi:two-component system cell cycle response regulator DivK
MKRIAGNGHKRHGQCLSGSARAPGAELPRVLVVDDNVLNIELVKYVIGTGHCRVEAAPGAERALSLIAAFEPHLILMDIQLPGMNGLELTRLIKTDLATRHIVVLAFTAYAMPGDHARLLAAGFDGRIAKPIKIETFVTDVLAHLGPVDAGRETA